MIFDFLKRKKKSIYDDSFLSEENKQWNKMWEMWSNGEIDSLYNELMNYHGEVSNGGHSQYFVNTDNCSDLNKEMSAVNDILPDILKENLKAAYEAHLLLEKDESDLNAESVMQKCDDLFFENENLIIDILEKFCMEI